jgi:hypothetical protein
MERVPVNDKILAAAQKLLGKPAVDHSVLRRIISGKVKSIDADWWREAHGVVAAQVNAKREKDFKRKLADIKAMADPERNPNAHQRQVAEAAFTKLEAAGAPKAPHVPSARGLEEYDRQMARRREEIARTMAPIWAAMKNPSSAYTAKSKPKPTTKPVNTTKAEPTKPVNTTTSKPRTADRHRQPNRDRHSPDYMRRYMAARRARQKPSQ